MSKNILLYKNITALSREIHKTLKLKTVKNFSFAADTHWLPITGTEFYQASRQYSIVFIKGNEAGKETFIPIILTGLEVGHNDYVSKEGKWKENTYLPAFIRRYPFVVIAQEDNASKLTLCFDASFSGFNEKEGIDLFHVDSSNSAFLDETIRFVEEFNLEIKRTHEFVNLLQDMDLLENGNAEIRRDSGEVFHVHEFLLVSKEKLAKLTGEQLAKFNEKGFLDWIFAHLMSLRNLTELFELHLSNKALSSQEPKGKVEESKKNVKRTPDAILDSETPSKKILH